jgi:hypothetical protein
VSAVLEVHAMSFDWYRQEKTFSKHPKTAELVMALGDKNAGMYVIRFWEWLATYAPRGVFKKSLTEHIERWCEWSNEPGQLLRALIETGWIELGQEDTLIAHDWWEHQRALVEKAEKDAARKRRQRRNNVTRTSRGQSAQKSDPRPRDGARTGQDETRRDETDKTGRNETEVAPRPASLAPVPRDLMELWNSVAHQSLPRCAELTEKRTTAAKGRLAERSLPVWKQVIERINQSAFCRGKNDRAWVATFDWLLQPDVAVKVLEGKYDNRESARAGPDPNDGIVQREAVLCSLCGAPAIGAVFGITSCGPCGHDVQREADRLCPEKPWEADLSEWKAKRRAWLAERREARASA